MGDVVATVNGNGDIKKVLGTCKRCGRVETNDWDYEDFFPEGFYGSEDDPEV